MGDSHRFRFFVDTLGVAGATVALRPDDVRHARVLRLGSGDGVEVVDLTGRVWLGDVIGAGVRLLEALDTAAAPRAQARIELIAGALTGNAFDTLVDGAVQAGVAQVTPLVANARERARLIERTARLRRIAEAAAKQSKRTSVPSIGAPIDHDELMELPAGVVLDARGVATLDRLLAAPGIGSGPQQADVTLLIGPAEGFEPAFVDGLEERGWRVARLGATILRAELAAAVAVAVAAMTLDRS